MSRDIVVTIAAALAARLAFAALGFGDYWGDAYHNWLISHLTIANDGIYADYKGRQVVWEPLYRYLATGATALLGRADMVPGRLVSLLASAATCGVVTALGTRLTGARRAGLAAGLVLALTPWHVAYGWMYMPEATAGLLVAGIALVLVGGGRPWMLLPLAALAVLARHDAAVLVLLAIGGLAATGRPREAAWLAGGVVAGLVPWCWWTWHETGHAFWWLTRRAAGSSADAAFGAALGTRPAPRPWTIPFMVVQAFAPVLVLAAAPLAGARLRRRVPGVLWVMVLGFLLVLLVMQFRFFSYPDPRYALVLAPLLSAITVAAVRGTRLVRPLAIVVVLSLAIQLPTFAFRPYALARDRAIGEALAAAAPAEGRLLVDAPVAIYYSRLDPARFVSSDQIAAAGETGPEAVTGRDIRWIYWKRAPSTAVPALFPRMAGGEAFEAGGRRYEPVARYDEWTAPAPGSWRASIRARVEAARGPGVLWHVKGLP